MEGCCEVVYISNLGLDFYRLIHRKETEKQFLLLPSADEVYSGLNIKHCRLALGK